ncbi:AbrB family transcriptional regulator [Alicyclobacillus fastidiosus]|uniref:AbrB family transcriptional regulator n=1 Tax=Alicyclobacillus fastidiosus TaxID=392011 RepID=A0ABV5ALN7_9BACL|nr:AbrB family transcriptional regulator [Alicyclobacillus fastidiosus]WEH11043.1 AbrB family transcriptional regulator [Alicyclobacillus fastidiosus]
MKPTGIIRKTDVLGRIVIPVELRRTLSIQAWDQFEIFTDGKTVILSKCDAACILCGNKDDTKCFKGKLVCVSCIDEMPK